MGDSGRKNPMTETRRLAKNILAAIAVSLILAGCGGGGGGGSTPNPTPMPGGNPSSPPYETPEMQPPSAENISDWLTFPANSNPAPFFWTHSRGDPAIGNTYRGSCFTSYSDSTNQNNCFPAQYVPIHQYDTEAGTIKINQVIGHLEYGGGMDTGGYFSRPEDVGSYLGITDYGWWNVNYGSNIGTLIYFAPENYGGDGFRSAMQEHAFGKVDQEIRSSENPRHIPGVHDATHFAVGFGVTEYIDESLEYLPPLPFGYQGDPSDYPQMWSAKYEGLMTGIARNHENKPVIGNSTVYAEFDDTNWLNSIDITMDNIRGSNFQIDDIVFPTIKQENNNTYRPPIGSYLLHDSFTFASSNMFVEGAFNGTSHDAIHGIFSTDTVIGGFGALQTESKDRPPLE